MEGLGFHRRISMRVGSTSSGPRFGAGTAGPEQAQSPSSHPTTPIEFSSAGVDNNAKPNLLSTGRISSALLSFGLQSPPHSSPCLGPSSSQVSCLGLSSLQVQSFGQGQFSDAESDGVCADIPDQKRQKRHSTAQMDRHRTITSDNRDRRLAASSSQHEPLPPGGSTGRIQPNHPIIRATSATQVTSVTERPSSRTNLQKTCSVSSCNVSGLAVECKPTPKSIPKPASSSLPASFESTSQLPFATRALANLVGIPASSQAIIQSTLSLPSSRSASHNGGSLKGARPRARTKRAPSTGTCSAAPSSASIIFEHGAQAVGTVHSDTGSLSSHTDPYLALLDSSTASVAPSIDTSASLGKVKNSANSLARSATIASEAAARPSVTGVPIAGAQSIVPMSKSRMPLEVPTYGASTADVPPCFVHSEDSSGVFSLPAPGTFSIRAPSSFEQLQSLDYSLSPQTPENRFRGTEDQLEDSEADSLCQGRNSWCASSRAGAGSVLADQLPQSPASIASDARKRKPRAPKSKINSQGGQPDGDDPEVELVPPPPTINGRTSHSRKVPAGYVKRTPNSFLMFRSHVIANKLLPPGVENDSRQISRVVSGLWAGLSEDDYQTWKNASSQLRAAAQAKNPDLKHPPNKKRKEIVRRRRSGQLPGETPEQCVKREKATAAACAKAIMEAKGGPLDKGQLSALSGLSMPQSQSTSQAQFRDSVHESGPERRAPRRPSTSTHIAPVFNALSEYSESTLTTSSAVDAKRYLPYVPEAKAEDEAMQGAPVKSTSACGSSTVCPALISARCQGSQESSLTTKPPAQFRGLQDSEDIGTNKTGPQPPIASLNPLIPQDLGCKSSSQSKSHPEQSALASDANAPNPNDAELAAFSDLFATPNSQATLPVSYAETFSNELLRSLGLAGTSFDLDFLANSTNQSQPPAPAPVNNDSTITGYPLAQPSNHGPSSAADWSQGRTVENVGGLGGGGFPFDNLPGLKRKESETPTPTDSKDSFSPLEQLSQLAASDQLDFGSLMADSFSNSLAGDGMDFDTMYLDPTANAISNSQPGAALDPVSSGSAGEGAVEKGKSVSDSLMQNGSNDRWNWSEL